MIPFSNLSGEDIPPFAVLFVTDAGTVGGIRGFAGVTMPAENTASWAINGRVNVPADGNGVAFPPQIQQWCAYDSATGTPNPGDEWGPVPDNWKLSEKGFGFLISKVDASRGIVYGGAPVLSGMRVASMNQKIKNGQTKKAQLKEGWHSESAGPEIDVYNRIYDEIPAGVTLYVSSIKGRWEIIAIDAEDDDESSSESESESESSSSGSGSDDSDGSGGSDGSGSDGSLPSGGSSGSGVSNSGSFSGSGNSGSQGSGSSSGSSTGSDGGTGSSKDNAIVPASWTEFGYVALHVTESPEVRFEDVLVIEVEEDDSNHKIDFRFVEVCEAGTIEAAGAVPDLPVAVGARVVYGDTVRIRVARSLGYRFRRWIKRQAPRLFGSWEPDPVRVVVSLTAIRKDFGAVRFPGKNKPDFEANERWLRRR